jgi:hypothetical protein
VTTLKFIEIDDTTSININPKELIPPFNTVIVDDSTSPATYDFSDYRFVQLVASGPGKLLGTANIRPLNGGRVRISAFFLVSSLSRLM